MGISQTEVLVPILVKCSAAAYSTRRIPAIILGQITVQQYLQWWCFHVEPDQCAAYNVRVCVSWELGTAVQTHVHPLNITWPHIWTSNIQFWLTSLYFCLAICPFGCVGRTGPGSIFKENVCHQCGNPCLGKTLIYRPPRCPCPQVH